MDKTADAVVRGILVCVAILAVTLGALAGCSGGGGGSSPSVSERDACGALRDFVSAWQRAYDQWRYSGNSGGPDSTVLLSAARPVESAANRLDGGEFVHLAREFASAAEANQRGIYFHADYLTVIHDANAMGTICGQWHLQVDRIVDTVLDRS